VFILQGKDASKLAGNRFQLLLVLFTKGYYQHHFFLSPIETFQFGLKSDDSSQHFA